MKNLLSILFLTCTASSFGQAKLKAKNPAPRVGEEVVIEFSIDRHNTDSIEVLESEKIVFDMMNYVGYGRIELGDSLTNKEGPISIGPIQIPINGKTYTTNELNLTVYPELPSDIDHGIWIRIVNSQGAKYIIVEQRQPFIRERDVQIDGNRARMNSDNVAFATLDIYKLYENGIEAKSDYGFTYPTYIEIGQVHYRIQTYKYTTLPTFKGHLTIDQSFFINFPKKTFFLKTEILN